MKSMPPKVVVVGSLNVDYMFRVPRIPQKGETLMARGVDVQFGGKGANQAVAAARAGCAVWLIGCAGDDDAGKRYRSHLEDEGIHLNGLFTAATTTGSAFIAVDDRGDNTILVHPGANARLGIEHILECESLIREADVLLIQLECPLPVVACAAIRAKAAGARVIANLSPFHPAAIAALQGADAWIVNETEFELLTGGLCVEKEPEWSGVLKRLGCKRLVITRGADPALLVEGGSVISLPPPQVTPVDTVGAGDAFAGAFTAALGEGKPPAECVRFANAAGSLATLERGAQNSIPRREHIEKLLEKHRTGPHPR